MNVWYDALQFKLSEHGAHLFVYIASGVFLIEWYYSESVVNRVIRSVVAVIRSVVAGWKFWKRWVNGEVYAGDVTTLFSSENEQKFFLRLSSSTAKSNLPPQFRLFQQFFPQKAQKTKHSEMFRLKSYRKIISQLAAKFVICSKTILWTSLLQIAAKLIKKILKSFERVCLYKSLLCRTAWSSWKSLNGCKQLSH